MRPIGLEPRRRSEQALVSVVQEAYVDTEYQMTTESYSCGSGTSFQLCTRMVSRPVNVTKYRSVMKPVDVTDPRAPLARTLAPFVVRCRQRNAPQVWER